MSLALMPASAVSQQKSLKDQLVGTWHLVSWERTNPDGSKWQGFGSNPKGVNHFAADGRFFVIYARGDLPKLKQNDRAKVTPEEAKALYEGTIAYHGTYAVDEANKTIAFRIETTTFPNQIGQKQIRVVSAISADGLKYRNPASTAGGSIEVALRRTE
jgi:hypothetical protein